MQRTMNQSWQDGRPRARQETSRPSRCSRPPRARRAKQIICWSWGRIPWVARQRGNRS